METKMEIENTSVNSDIIAADTRANEEFLKRIFLGSWMTQAVSVAAELGIADLLEEGPRTIGDLAEQTRTHAGSLYRVMRALAGAGIFTQDPDSRFSLTPPAELLRSNAVRSQRFFAIMMGAEFCGAWGELLHSVRTGESGFEKKFGAPAFQYMVEHPDRHSIYDRAMGEYGQEERKAVVDAYDFSGFRTVADIGGGNGVLLTSILKRYPDVEGMLFDLPPVADRARSFILESGLSARCRVEGGDFFSSIPAGADVYILQHVVHDWDDDDAISILHNCRKAMNPDGRILLLENVIPQGNEPCFVKWLDCMMLLVGGRERMAHEYRRLLSDAGLMLDRIIPTESEISIVEGVHGQ